ncbi:biogenesis of lysosome-related organelles complex 1 subunit 6-like [Liolophura sinensis]|uniref:biogenesis of lysosome-related organelles complex 1 subunit 6-like n=1 Tax=Liolophura sinensis TaxID=3198878 RepID=UPI00315860BB
MLVSAANFHTEMSETVDRDTQHENTEDSVAGPNPELESFPVPIDGADMTEKDHDTREHDRDNSVEEIPQQPVVDSALIESMTQGFLAKFMPDLQDSKAMLDELMRNQRVLLDTVQQENSKFDECQSFRDLEETMKQARLYHGKLLSIKKEMNSLHEKSARLKKRSVKLQQQKQKMELQRAHQRDKLAERERMLVAKPAPQKQVTPANTDSPTTAEPS